MKKILTLACLSLLLFSCTDPKKQEEALLAEVIKIHDVVMGKEEFVMHSKMKLDTLIADHQDAKLTAEATAVRAKLDSADVKMEDWMHHFDAENKGKSHDEIIKYLEDQKKQINAIDQHFNSTIATAEAFIKQNNIK